MLKQLIQAALVAITQSESIVVGALLSGLVLLAKDLHIVVNKASLAVILTPLITAIIVELDKQAGVSVSARRASKGSLDQ
jgi:hypothetical protein